MTRETPRAGIVGAVANMKARHMPGLQAIAGVETALGVAPTRMTVGADARGCALRHFAEGER